MLKIIRSLKELDFSSLAAVYEGSLFSEDAGSSYGRFCAEQEFYQYLRDVFFADSESWYAVWAPQDVYTAALRMEPYRDGLLVAGLETAPEARNRGYATALLQAVLLHLSERGKITVYSHIDKSNVPSIRIHEKSGFTKLFDYAVFIDGSYSSSTYTYFLNR